MRCGGAGNGTLRGYRASARPYQARKYRGALTEPSFGALYPSSTRLRVLLRIVGDTKSFWIGARMQGHLECLLRRREARTSLPVAGLKKLRRRAAEPSTKSTLQRTFCNLPYHP